jgi:hypothetical protein
MLLTNELPGRILVKSLSRQEIFYLQQDPTVPYLLKDPSLGPILSQINSVSTLTSIKIRSEVTICVYHLLSYAD